MAVASSRRSPAETGCPTPRAGSCCWATQRHPSQRRDRRPRLACSWRSCLMTAVMSSDWRGAATELDRSLLSVIVPIYNEEDTLPELERRLPTAVAGLGFLVLEFLLVSDGSVDRSEAVIRQIVARDGRFRGIFLTRNFGHQAAVSTGLAHARGSVVAIIDGDLQDPPEAIAALVEALAGGADVAYGVRDRKSVV